MDKKLLKAAEHLTAYFKLLVRSLNKDQETPTYYAVYSCNDKTKNLLFVTEDEAKARKFCKNCEWEWQDDYGDYRLFYTVTR